MYLSTPGKPPYAFHLDNGAATGPVLVGTYRVEIMLYKPDPNPQKAKAGSDTVNCLPPRYNAESTLTAEVTESGPNQFTFAVTSK